MARLILFNTSKRRNSTLVPSDGDVRDVKLKNATSFLHPSFVLQDDGYPNYSMCQFAGKYYFIEDITSVRDGLWELTCSIDPLSTYKANILATTAFVEYATVGFNPLIADTRLIQNAAKEVVSQAVQLTGTTSTNDFRYIMTVVGKNGSGAGFTSNYSIATQGALNRLANIFYDNTEILEELKQYWTSAFDCIISCVAVPFQPPEGSIESISLGGYSTGVSGVLLSTTVASWETNVTIPWKWSDFRMLNGYTKLKLFLPFVGSVALSTADFFGQTSIRIKHSVDFITGDIIYYIMGSAEGDRPIITYSGNCGIKIPVAQYQQNTGAIVGGVTSVLEGYVSGLVSAKPQASLNSLTGLVGVSMEALKSSPSVIGSASSAAMSTPYGTQVILTAEFFNTSVEPETVAGIMGRPVMKVMGLSGLSGYCETRGASVAGTMLAEERRMINSFLDGGIYIE